MSLQAISISKAINTQEAPVKEKHARRILPASGSQGRWEDVEDGGLPCVAFDHGHGGSDLVALQVATGAL